MGRASGALSAAEARRVALAAQGFGGATISTRPGMSQLRALAQRLHLFQIDSVNVLVRAHYLPAFSRLGDYPVEALDRLAYQKRELFEYWGHAACLVPVQLHPLLRWRMEGHATQKWGDSKEKGYADSVYAQVADRGPISAGELAEPGRRGKAWWGWGDGKMALEWLFASGRLAIAGRRGFERLYDLTERVIPGDVLAAPTPQADDAKRALLELAARALGVGTANDIAWYFYVDYWWDRTTQDGKRVKSQIASLVAELVEAGRLVPVTVEGWSKPAYMHPEAKVPKKMDVTALVSPFDSLVWERERTERLFGLRYRIEIYTPAAKREYGYYVLPFLMGDRLVGRVDLKADRKAKRLLVPGAFAETGFDPRRIAGALLPELRKMSDWLGLEGLEIGSRGDVAPELARLA